MWRALTQHTQLSVCAAIYAFIIIATAHAQELKLNPTEILKASTPAPEVIAPEKIAQGYLYVETYQARFEALMDATRIQNWLNPLKELPASLDAATQKKLSEQATQAAQDWCRLQAGNLPVEAHFIGASVIKGKPGATLPFEEGEAILTSEAMIGFIWEFPTPPAPDQLTVEWRGFTSEIKALPIRVFFGKKTELLEVSTLLSKATWKAQGHLPMPAPLSSLPAIITPEPFFIPLATLIWVMAGLAFYSIMRIREHHLPGGTLPFLLSWLLGTVLTWPILNIDISGSAEIPVITEKAQAEAILTPLLRNVYRAFDHRAESQIYDVLAMSVDGELLRKLYLETIQALTLDGREGTRVTISEFSADILKVQSNSTAQGFITEVQWTALGSVGHWGHAHTRVNRYTAKVTVAPIKSAWKIVGLDVSEARRL